MGGLFGNLTPPISRRANGGRGNCKNSARALGCIGLLAVAGGERTSTWLGVFNLISMRKATRQAFI
jgi:hypothetical protein